ncbi:MAG: hypothetical protein ABR987_06275 [Terracidiphilus sp.]|jgi:hypothetical protein
MRKLAVIAGLAVAFFLGILLGIRWDWSTWLQTNTDLTVTTAPPVQYEVESYGQANLMLSPGNKLTLVRPGDPYDDIAMYFKGGNSPCNEGDGITTCTIKDAKDLQPGPYFFRCDSNDKKYRCPDPGIQPQTTGPFQNEYSLQTLSYSRDLGDVLAHVFESKNGHLKVETKLQAQPTSASKGIAELSGTTPKFVKTTATSAQFSAYIVCNAQNSTAEIDPIDPHEPMNNQIPVPQGSTLTWIGNSQFSVTFKPGTYPCGSQTVSSNLIDGSYQAICAVDPATPVAVYHYTGRFGAGCQKPTIDETISVTKAN